MVVVGVVVIVVFRAVDGTGNGPRNMVSAGPGFQGGNVSCKKEYSECPKISNT